MTSALLITIRDKPITYKNTRQFKIKKYRSNVIGEVSIYFTNKILIIIIFGY